MIIAIIFGLLITFCIGWECCRRRVQEQVEEIVQELEELKKLLNKSAKRN